MIMVQERPPLPTTFRLTSANAASASPSTTPTIAVNPIPTDERCQYPSKPCNGRRAVKINGELHRLCEFHRTLANRNQQRLQQRRRVLQRQKAETEQQQRFQMHQQQLQHHPSAHPSQPLVYPAPHQPMGYHHPTQHMSTVSPSSTQFHPHAERIHWRSNMGQAWAPSHELHHKLQTELTSWHDEFTQEAQFEPLDCVGELMQEDIDMLLELLHSDEEVDAICL